MPTGDWWMTEDYARALSDAVERDRPAPRHHPWRSADMPEPVTPAPSAATVPVLRDPPRPLPPEYLAPLLGAWEGQPDAAEVAADVELLALRAEVARLRAALRDVLDPLGRECRRDHNGNCQEHFISDPCPVAEAWAALGEG
jgi:hypothetical protein